MSTRSKRPRIRLRVGIAAMFLGIMLPLTALMTTVLYRQNSHLAADLAQNAMDGASRDVVSGVRNLLVPMARVVDLSTAFGKAEGEKLRRVETLRPLIDTLEAFPDLYALFFGFAKDGAFYEVIRLPPPGGKGLLGRKPPPDAKFALRIIDTVEGEATDSWIYITRWGNVVGVERAPKVTYDPRTRPWYTAAMETQGVATSGIHVFSSIGKPGLTLSQRLVTDDGAPIGVFAADLLTETLSRFLAERAVGAKGRTFILDEDDRLLGYHDAEQSLVQGGNGLEIAKVDQIADRVVADAARLRKDLGNRFRAELGPERDTYLVSFSPFPDDFGKHWTIGVVAEEGEFIAPLRRASVIILIIGTAFLVLAGAGVAWASRLLTRPIETLIGEVRHIEALDFSSDAAVRSSVIEVHALAAAIERMKAAMRSFAAYVPKDLVRTIMASAGIPTIDGERRPLTILFTDLQGFTQTSEFMAPEDVAHRLSIYFEMMSGAIIASRGTIDKFIGDAIMAFWNAPSLDEDHVANACRAILACRVLSEDLNRDLVANRFPPMPTRFGLHTGVAVVGNVGSNDRMQYTVLGAEVNLASRIEGLNKMFGTSMLVTGAVEKQVRDRFLFRPLGVVAPAGVTLPVPLFELVAALDDGGALAATGEQMSAVAHWNQAMKLFFARDWSAASQAFRDYLAGRGEDGPARFFLDLAERYAAAPPDEAWDGVLHFEGK
ncbi:cache domain-containing protein [Magnetospirillum sp. ME-1]|uniref:cache domain-containing protein n=1 Tax=Magnetospirillum sp. ME-1 TaxID=1639348 RepID=UPI0011AE812A|nr:adenylate/guanylate cyclase domain-containing protein [Magnetospirillum sp. ME-1]